MSKTFVRITNKEIYNKIEELISNNQKEHQEIKEHVIQTNGKVKLNRWLSSTALTLVILLISLWAR